MKEFYLIGNSSCYFILFPIFYRAKKYNPLRKLQY